MTTATSLVSFKTKEQNQDLALFISTYRQKLLKGDPKTFRFNLNKDELESFLNSSDFRLFCELLSGTKEFEPEENIYTVKDLNPGISNPKLKNVHISGFDSFRELIEHKYAKQKKSTKINYTDSIIDIDIKKVKFEDAQVNYKFLKAIFPSKHESEVEEIRNKTITCIKYFSGLFELFASAPYILKTKVTEDNRTIDLEIIDIAKVISQGLTLKRFKEIATEFYQDDSMRDEFTISELFKSWSYYSKKSTKSALN